MIFLTSYDTGVQHPRASWGSYESTHLCVKQGNIKCLCWTYCFLRKFLLYMKQRVLVKAIIRRGDKTLLLRDLSRGDTATPLGLPGGRLHLGVQPEQSLSQHIKSQVGAEVKSVQLFDVVVLYDVKNSTNNIYVVYLATIDNNKTVVKNIEMHWLHVWDLQQHTLTDIAQAMIGSYSPSKDNYYGNNNNDVIPSTYIADRAVIYSDGGSRGNPGVSAAGYVIKTTEGSVVENNGVFLGITTSAQAEYNALKIALERALVLGFKKVECRIDNLMIVNQMKGIYQVKNRQLWPVHEYIIDLISQFDEVEFVHVRREFNTFADSEVNRILDEHATEAIADQSLDSV